jgi:hypothetical protein
MKDGKTIKKNTSWLEAHQRARASEQSGQQGSRAARGGVGAAARMLLRAAPMRKRDMRKKELGPTDIALGLAWHR